MTTAKQTKLKAESDKFWKDACQLSTKGRYVNFVDGDEEIIDIKDWTIHQVDSNWGKKPCLKTTDDRFLKLESKRLRFLVSQFVDRTVKLSITRFDSQPNPLQTWWTVEEVPTK